VDQAAVARTQAGSGVDSMDSDVTARITRLVRACQACIERAACGPRAGRVEIARELADRIEVPAGDAEVILLQALLGAVAAVLESLEAGAARDAPDGLPDDVQTRPSIVEVRRAFLDRVRAAVEGGSGSNGPTAARSIAAAAPDAPPRHSDGDTRAAASSSRDDRRDDLADRAARLIQRDFACCGTVADLARALHCHPRRLQECFRLRHHTSVHRYLDRVRADEATRLIGEAGLKVEAAALMVGLRSRKNLYALVRRTTGLTVGEVRRAGRGAVQPP